MHNGNYYVRELLIILTSEVYLSDVYVWKMITGIPAVTEKRGS